MFQKLYDPKKIKMRLKIISLAPKLMAGIVVLVSAARADEFSSAYIAGARLHFDLVLSQSLFGREGTVASFILSYIHQLNYHLLVA